MRGINDDSSSSIWRHFHCGKSAPFVQYNNGYLQRSLTDTKPEHERDALKQKMLEHEAVFKNQVCELHLIYQTQRNMMEEVKMKDFHSFRPSMEPSSRPQFPLNVAKWNASPFPLWEKQSSFDAEIANSPVSLLNTSTSNEDHVALNRRPSKLRNKTFDLQLPADEYIDLEEGATKNFLVDHSGSTSYFTGSREFFDLNEPVRIKEALAPSVHILDFSSESNTESKSLLQQAKSYEPGFFSRGVTDSRTQSNQLDRYPFLAHFHPNQVRVLPDVHPISFGNEEDCSVSGSYNGYLGCESSHKASAFPFSSSFQSAQASVKPSNSFCRLNFGAGVVNHVSEPLPRSQDRFFGKMLSNSSFDSESIKNGFYRGSVSEENRINLHPPGFNFSNCVNPSFHQDEKSATMAIDLNEDVPRSYLDEVPEGLPWLKPKISANNSKIRSENEIIVTKPVNKIMGFVFFDRNSHENEISSVASTSASLEGKSSSCFRKTRMIDINVACVSDEVHLEEQPLRDYIDLNSTVDYYEIMMARDENKGASSIKRMLEIDLEVPFVPEFIDPRKAAELVLAMSSMLKNEDDCRLSEDSLSESLLLFADAITPHENVSGSDEMDDFEVMTLKLEEQRNELQVHFVEENGSTKRQRRGQARRGRQRRDFQRYILPGIISLSRNEMTEDLHIFGCLTRGMRRNSTSRGKKRDVIEASPLIQKLNNIEDRSLTGWRKTTKRPRQQGCSQGD